jgi:hypothetical protein
MLDGRCTDRSTICNFNPAQLDKEAANAKKRNERNLAGMRRV